MGTNTPRNAIDGKADALGDGNCNATRRRSVSKMATVKKGRMTRTKEREKHISNRNRFSRLQSCCKESEEDCKPLGDIEVALDVFIAVGVPLRKMYVAGYGACAAPGTR